MWEIISGILGILGFIISVVQIITSLINNRRNLLFHLDTAYIRGNDFFIRYRVDNLSDKPISLTSIQLLVGNEKINTNFISVFVTESIYRADGEVIYHEVKGTELLPINLSGGESHGGHLSFAVSPDNQPCVETALNFRVSTNHGKPFQMILSPNGDFRTH